MSASAKRTLAQLGRRYGNDLLVVQAAGGNVSIKTSPKTLFIKASGVRLREMTPSFGWASANPVTIDHRMGGIARQSTEAARELSYARLLQDACLSPGRRVSMETGFHVILPQTFVYHLHSVGGILLGMMPEAKARAILSDIFQDRVQVTFVPAILPGFELMKKIQTLQGSNSKSAIPNSQLLILRNHGVVWSAKDKKELVRVIGRFEQQIRKRFELDRYPIPHHPGAKGCRHRRAIPFAKDVVCFCRWPRCQFELEPLFPDFVIYFDLWSRGGPDVVKVAKDQGLVCAKTPLQWRDKMEVLYAHAVVSTIAKARGWYQTLPRPMIRALKAMETERLRKQQILCK